MDLDGEHGSRDGLAAEKDVPGTMVSPPITHSRKSKLQTQSALHTLSFPFPSTTATKSSGHRPQPPANIKRLTFFPITRSGPVRQMGRFLA